MLVADVPPELRVELAPAAESVARAGRRLGDLLSAIPDPDRLVHGLDWTLAELVAHLAARSGAFAAYLSGAKEPEGEIGDVAKENQVRLEARGDRMLGENVGDLRSNVASFVTATRGKLGADPFPWYSGITLDVATATGLLLGELLVHGHDAARTLGRRWRIPAQDARTVVRAATVLAPRYVDPVATLGVRTTYRLALRGGPAFRVRIADGTAAVEPSHGDADCTIRIDPAALMLISYGRSSIWRAAATGKVLVTGRRPWRALGFARSFVRP